MIAQFHGGTKSRIQDVYIIYRNGLEKENESNICEANQSISVEFIPCHC